MRTELKNHLLKPGGRLLITDLSFDKLLIEKISLKYKNGWSLLIFLELSWAENCLEESPFKTRWKVVDDWSSFFKFPNEIKTYILNIRMLVHDWERKEYKILLNFFSVVKYKLCIYNVLWFADLIQNHQVYNVLCIYKTSHIVWTLKSPCLKGGPCISMATLGLLQSHCCAQARVMKNLAFQVSTFKNCCTLRVERVVHCNIRSKTNLLLFVFYILLFMKIYKWKRKVVSKCQILRLQLQTSQELRMLSRSLSDCQSLTFNVMIQVSHFVSNSQLWH